MNTYQPGNNLYGHLSRRRWKIPTSKHILCVEVNNSYGIQDTHETLMTLTQLCSVSCLVNSVRIQLIHTHVIKLITPYHMVYRMRPSFNPRASHLSQFVSQIN